MKCATKVLPSIADSKKSIIELNTEINKLIDVALNGETEEVRKQAADRAKQLAEQVLRRGQ